MTKKILSHFIVILTLCCSCVNNDYDLDTIDTSDIVFGTHLSLPIGTKNMTLKNLLDIENSENIQVIDGKYSIKLANKLPFAPMPEIVIDDYSLPLTFNIPTSVVNFFNAIPGVISSPLERQHINSSSISFDNFSMSEEIVKIDSVIMKAGDVTTTKFTINLKLTEFNFKNPVASIIFKMKMPIGYKLLPLDQFTIDSEGKYNMELVIPYNEVDTPMGKDILFTIEKLGALTSENKAFIDIYLDVMSAEELRFGSNPNINADIEISDINFEVVYGEFDIVKDISPVSVSLANIIDIFGENAILDFYNPVINIKGHHNFGFESGLNLNFMSKKGNVTLANSNTEITLPSTLKPNETIDFNINLGPIAPSGTTSEFIDFDINALLKGSPTEMLISGNIKNTRDNTKISFVTSEPEAIAKYEINIPFTLGSDSELYFTQQIDDIFTEELARMFFSSGSVEFFGTVNNTLPLNLEMELLMLDSDNTSIAIDLDKAQIKGSENGTPTENSISFKLDGHYFESLQKARSIKIQLKASSNEKLKGIQFKETDYVDLKLKLRKTGGISINL